MTDGDRAKTDSASRATIARLAADTLPRLIDRLAKSELGELEVRDDGWRIRLRKPSAGNGATAPASHSAGERSRAAGGPPSAGAPLDRASASVRTAHASRPEPAPGTVTSPAVGYFVSRDGVAVGAAVSRGDLIGHVDVLGMRQEVVAPIAGVVKSVEVEGGQAIEYGQRIAFVQPAEANVQ